MPYTVLLVCFFISGATALIYEVIWVRLLALTFGNTVYAVGIVLTSFMSGLSVGSLVIGRWADRGRNLLRGYGFLEWGIAVSALLSPPFLERITGIYLSLSITSLPLWTVSVIRYLLSIAVLLIPTTLMGGTLPVLSRFFIRSEADLEKRLGELYSLNTIGGVLGTFLVGFIMMRFIGISMTLKITALVNAGIGGIAYYLGTRQAPAGRMEVDVADAGPEKEPGYAFALSAFFVSGFTAMVYEVAWSRLLVGVIGSTTYAFSIILIGFLSGIGIGSLIVSRISSARRLGLVHFSGIEVLIGLSCFLTLVVFSILPHMMLRGLQMTGHSYSSVLAVDTLIVLFYLLVPTGLFGATFPVIAGIYSGGQRHRGSNIGNIYAANTFGAIFGSSLAAFYLLPHFGASASVKLASLVNVLVGLTGIALLRKFRLLAACAVLLAVPLMPVSITEEAMVSGVAVYGKRADFTLESDMQTFLYLGEGLNATIAVTTNDDGSITLSTNGKADGSTGGDMSTQLALAYFPLFLHRDPADVLIIGYGTGVTARAAADYADVERIDAIEIEPDVLAAGDLFNPVSRGALHDPKLKLHIDDARSYIVASQKRYDVIISEPSNPWISGIGNLFSREFFEMSRARLKQGGLFCQWVQLYGLNPDVLKMIIRTFSAVFP
ncbi:MAG TPA: fused MFS/spermidine synthase, partial [Thermodesulfovibrionales bacterium]|nr:fused MFS/spermidine synthase [Thermodesulfovibrionales bacterium]